MTLLGKICIVLILIMSIVFMSFSIMVYATHRNWRDLVKGTTDPQMPKGLETQLQDLENENDELDGKLENLKFKLASEQAARRQALAKLEEHSRNQQQTLANREQENRDLVLAKREAIQAMNDAQANLSRLKDEVEQLRQDIRVAQQNRDDVFARFVELSDRHHQRLGDERRLKEQNNSLLSSMSVYKQQLDRFGIRPETSVDDVAPPLDGKVLAARGRLIEISLGRDDGLEEGHELTVSRGTLYKARVIVRWTRSDRAVAEVIERTKQREIQEGDRVATRV